MNKSINNKLIVPLLHLTRHYSIFSKQLCPIATKRELFKQNGALDSCSDLQNLKWRARWPRQRPTRIDGVQFYSSTQSQFPASNLQSIDKELEQSSQDQPNIFNETEEASGINTTIDSPDDDDILDVQFITNGDPTLEKKLQVLFLEVDVLRQEGRKVPLSIKSEQWKELINTTTRSARRKYLSFLWGIEMKKGSKKRKKEEQKVIKEDSTTEYIDDGHIRYGLNNNTIYMRIYDTTINQLYNNKLVQAIQFGQKIVVDCGYDVHMTSREAQNAAKQIMILFSENRNHHDPFNLYLCNANREGHTLHQLQRFITTLYEDHFPLHVTEQSYLDLFPKENIVYLTPHCRDELTTFDHDAIYIIGGMVDKINQEPLSLAKAKKEGLRMAKLPLERYLNWGSGSGKSLTLNQMMLIMLEMKTSGDWKKALEHVPRRKLNHEDAPGSQYKARHRQQFQNKRDKYY